MKICPSDGFFCFKTASPREQTLFHCFWCYNGLTRGGFSFSSAPEPCLPRQRRWSSKSEARQGCPEGVERVYKTFTDVFARECFVKSRSLYEVQRQTERRGHGFARSARGSPRALLAPELVPGARARGGVLQLWWGDRGAVYPPRPHTARTHRPIFGLHTNSPKKRRCFVRQIIH